MLGRQILFLLNMLFSIVNMVFNLSSNVYISIGILAILVSNLKNFINDVLARYGLFFILFLKIFKSKNFNYYLAQTTKKRRYFSNISKLKTSNRRICSISSGDENSYPSVMGNIELDTHADTIVAGANCCIMSYTGRVCDVSPYSEHYKPVTGVPIVKAVTVWQSQYTGQEYLLILNEALWMPSLNHTLVNPNQLRAYGTIVQDNPYSGDPLFIQTSNLQFNMELHTTGTVIYAPTRTPTNEDLYSGDLPMVELSSPIEWNPGKVKYPTPSQTFEEVLAGSMDIQISALQSEHHNLSEFDVDKDLCGSSVFDLGDFSSRIISSTKTSDMFGGTDVLTDVPSPPSFTSGNRHTDVSPTDLAERWFISIPQAIKTLKKTTQKFVRSAILPLTRRYRADRMFYRKTLAGEWSTDTMDGHIKSLDGNRHATGAFFSIVRKNPL